MKKLMIAAVAATMSVAATADISIKGDAHLRYGNIDADANSAFAGIDSRNAAGQRVRLHVTGKSGDTQLKLGLRNDGGTRVSGGARQTEGAATGSGTGLGKGENDPDAAILATDYLYLTTKIGALNIKAGDWWDTTGLGVARKGKADADRIEFSTKVGGWKLGYETGADSSTSVFSANGKIAGFDTKIEHNSNVYVGGSAGLGATEAGKYTDISIKGKSGAVGIAAEYFKGTNDATNEASDAKLVHVWTKSGGVTWHAAWANVEEGVVGITGSGNKFSPLGVSILATAPGVNGKIALGDFTANSREDTVIGIRADTKIAGMGVQAAIGKLELGNNGSVADDTFLDLIVTRPLGKNSDIKFSAGTYDNATSLGTKLSVKF